MSPLDHLASLLRSGTEEGARALAVSSEIDTVLASIRERTKGPARLNLSEDRQLDAVRRFWQSQEIASFRDAYLLSWGLCLPYKPSGPCVLEDRPRLEAVLDGVDSWSERPSAFRRCYQGLSKEERRGHPVRLEKLRQLMQRKAQGLGRLARGQPPLVQRNVQLLNEAARKQSRQRFSRVSLLVL